MYVAGELECVYICGSVGGCILFEFNITFSILYSFPSMLRAWWALSIMNKSLCLLEVAISP